MASLKQDSALAVNLLGKDTLFCQLMSLATQEDRALRLVPMRQSPNSAMSTPLVSVYIQPGSIQGGGVNQYRLLADVYVPLSKQKASGISFDITRRIKEVLHGKPVGRRLKWIDTDPDKRSTTGWHKATVMFEFLSTQY